MTNYSTGTSHAKIILIGEHSAVYKKPSIVLPLFSLKMEAKITPIQNGQTIHSRYYNGNLSDAPKNLLGIKALVYNLLKKFNQSNANFDLQIKSNIPSECGMGSSAASSIAVTKALHNYFNYPLNRSLLLSESNIEEKITHGNPSGMDAAAASSEAPIWFIKGKSVQQVPFNIHGSLIIAYTGIQSQTNQAVSLVHKRLIDSSHHAQIKSAINQLGQIAIDAKQNLQTGSIKNIGHNMDDAQKQLTTLGVSIKAIDNLIQTGKKAGALGAKLTGSGLGGCVIMIAFKKDAKHIAQALKFAGATKTWIQNFN
ncbi:mevalonate kinase [Philodulcilactobacillus myokoensis]|uniref:Mevalonate kinase n=1 Tax=Philodulcilactobacillus myokoensis TaxID=2929573 RepID=A0A9W6B0W1_9LACO|nr:mevalonate kinase [Philodulcilactobacillus myokoensis]GLB46840.1 mevalonate kinase [Philodulcilactobacillus myokoensis]